MPGTRRILLENTGNYATVDSDDYDKVIAYGKWYENDSGYAVKKTRINGKNVSIRMHMLVNGTPIGCGFHTDHINGDRLDNRNQYVASAVFRKRFNTLEEAINFTKKGVDEI